MLISFGDFSHKVAKDRWDETVKKFKERIEDISVKVDTRTGISSVDLISKILIRLGPPVEEILKAVDEEGCDVIVIGTHSKGFFATDPCWECLQLGPSSNPETRSVVPLPSEDTNIDWIGT